MDRTRFTALFIGISTTWSCRSFFLSNDRRPSSEMPIENTDGRTRAEGPVCHWVAPIQEVDNICSLAH